MLAHIERIDTCQSIRLQKNNVFDKGVHSQRWTLTNVCIHKRGYTIGKVLIEKSKHFWQCRHSLVDSSSPSILPPVVRVPSTLSHFFNLYCSNCIFVIWIGMRIERRNKKRPGLAHLKKVYICKRVPLQTEAVGFRTCLPILFQVISFQRRRMTWVKQNKIGENNF